jgi:serine-type D-Ala-D-Ala carboxypeptidase (penicillin-binding protein 5/6)
VAVLSLAAVPALAGAAAGSAAPGRPAPSAGQGGQAAAGARGPAAVPGPVRVSSLVRGPGPVTVSGPAGVRARAAELADAGTGRRLWGRKAAAERPIASITKVMTALVVLRAGGLSREIRVTRAAVRYVRRNGASSAGLVAGDVLTARQLLAAMLVPSGCDAAYLLATAYGPGRAAFVRTMNTLATAMGLASTHFTSFDGLPIPTGHSTYSTPADLIRLGLAAMRYRLFQRIVGQRRHHLDTTARHHRYTWRSTNLLLGSYRGAIGIKTGTTAAAGDCLLFEARRGARTLIGVVLHANPTASVSSRFTAARKMLNWGFRNGLSSTG